MGRLVLRPGGEADEGVVQAEELARARGVQQLRVDCWAGAPTLVAWYEREGFDRLVDALDACADR